MVDAVSRTGRPKRCWAPPGIRPHVPSQVVGESVYIFAAVAPGVGLMTSLVLPSANTAMMNLFLEHVSQSFENYFMVMQVDQADWYRSKELIVPANIRPTSATCLQSRTEPGFALVGGTAREISAQSALPIT